MPDKKRRGTSRRVRKVEPSDPNEETEILARGSGAPRKPKPKGEPMVDTFITGVSQDTWIFFPWDMALQYVKPYSGKDD